MSRRIDYSKINLSVLPKGGNVVKATPKRVPIDYSKIDLKGTLPKVTGLSIPAKGRRIDYSAIEGPVVATPVVRPVHQAPVVSAPFTGRPLVTPVEQQRMKAAAPITGQRLFANTGTNVRNPTWFENQIIKATPLGQASSSLLNAAYTMRFAGDSAVRQVGELYTKVSGKQNPEITKMIGAAVDDGKKQLKVIQQRGLVSPKQGSVLWSALNAAPTIGTAILVSALGQPEISATLLGAYVDALSYGTYREAGVGVGKAALGSTAKGLFSAATMMVPTGQLTSVIGKMADTAAERAGVFALRVASQGVLGGTRQLASNVIDASVLDRWSKDGLPANMKIVMSGVMSAAITAALLTVPVAAFQAYVDKYGMVNQVARNIKKDAPLVSDSTCLKTATEYIDFAKKIAGLRNTPEGAAQWAQAMGQLKDATPGVKISEYQVMVELFKEAKFGNGGTVIPNEPSAATTGENVSTVPTSSAPVVPVSPTAAQPTVMPNIGAIPVIPTAPTIPTISQPSWEMTDAERQVKLSALRTQYKRELTTPLMSEGGISPMQVGQMSKSQKARYQADTMTRMDVEAQIRLLENPQEARARYERGIAANKEGQIASLRANIKALELLGVGKKNTIKPKYQVQIDKDQAEIDRLLAPQSGPVRIDPQKGPSAEISNQELSMGTTPAHGLIDYSRIELNGPTSQTSPKVLASVGNTGKGFDNYIQNTTGTTNTKLSPFAKFKEGRDGFVRFIANEYNWFFKSPLGGEWMAIAVAADDLLLEEYKKPFSINETGEQVFVGGEFAPAILARYLKQYGPNFGKFLQHLQRAGISTEPTAGLSADKEALKQQHIADAKMSLVNFQKNEPQLSKAYMAAADELGNANALLAEFYKGIISPETYAHDKANPHYYVSLSAGKTDIFDRSGVAPLERARGLTNLDEVVPPLEGLIAVYVDAIRAQGINNAKREAVKWNKNSEIATTVLSDSIVHLKENGVDRAYEVHDKDAGESIRNLTRSKWEAPSLVRWLAMSPTTLLRLFATGANIAFGVFNPVRDIIQAAGLVPFTPTGLVKGTVKAFKSPGLSQWSKDYRDPTRPTGTKVTEAVKKIVEILSIPSNVGESLGREGIGQSIHERGGTYLDQFYGYHAGTGFFALHGTFFNDFIASCVPFTKATIAVVRAAYRNAFMGLPIGGKGGTFSWKQGAEKIAGKNFLATIIFAVIEIMAIKAAGKEKEYKLLRDRASYFYFPQPTGNWVKLPVPIGSAPVKAIVESLYGYKSDPMDVARQTFTVIPGLEALMLPPALALYLQYRFNINFFTGSPIVTGPDTPAANPLEAALMKRGYTEEQVALALRSFFADIPSQFQYVFDMVTQGSSTQAFPLSKRFIVKDPTTSSNAAVDDFYALVDAAKMSKNPALEHYVNARGNAIGKLLHNAKTYPADAKVYITTATDNIIATFATIAENPETYGIKKFGSFSWRPKGNYEELAP